MGGKGDVKGDRAVDGHRDRREVAQRLAPDVEDGVGADEGVAQGRGLLGVEALGVLTVAGLGEVDVAGHTHQLARPTADPVPRLPGVT